MMSFDKDNFIKDLTALVESSIEVGATTVVPLLEVPVVKSINTDKRLFTAVVLRPNVVDSQGDIYNEEVVEKACHDYVENCMQGNLQHLIQTKLVVPVESWIAKTDFQLGAGEVLAGDWLLNCRIDDDEIWGMCLDGTFTGYSVGCTATVEELT